MDMVAFSVKSYKAPIDFVFFGCDKNDNNNEILVLLWVSSRLSDVA